MEKKKTNETVVSETRVMNVSIDELLKVLYSHIDSGCDTVHIQLRQTASGRGQVMISKGRTNISSGADGINELDNFVV